MTDAMSLLAETERILIVDDEEPIRALLTRLLGMHGYECDVAESAAAARRRLASHRYALVLSDVNMPGGSGLELAHELHADHPDTAVLLVTGVDDPRIAEAALEQGAYGYVLKPFKTNELLINVVNALRRRTLELENRHHRDRLEQTVLERTATLRETISRLESSESELRRLREETIRRLSSAAESRNPETGEHIVRMSLYCALLARLAGCDGERAELIRIASPMHDVGRNGIPVEGRITAIADVFDALTSDRVYRPAFQPDEARAMMLEGRGTQFDAELLDLFLGAFDDVLAIRRATADGTRVEPALLGWPRPAR